MEIYIAPGWNKCYLGSTLEEIISQAEKDMFKRMEEGLQFDLKWGDDNRTYSVQTAPKMDPWKTWHDNKRIELRAHYIIRKDVYEEKSEKTKLKYSDFDRHSCTMTLRRQPT